MSRTFKELPASLKIHVDYYDAEQKKKLLAAGAPPLSAEPLLMTIDTPELATFYMYRNLRPGVPGHSTHADIVAQAADALIHWKGHVVVCNDSLQLLQVKDTDKGVTEHIGEAIGLSVISEMNGLHAADWLRIGITSLHKTLDFRNGLTASTGSRLIELETKGAAVVDNSRTDLVAAAKSSIDDKKSDDRNKVVANALRYGTIAALDARTDGIARCWLVDPPAESEGDPKRFKIIARMSFVADFVTLLGGRSAFAASLRTRVAALLELPDISPLSFIPLLNGYGEPFASAWSFAEPHPWFSFRSTVLGGRYGGQVSFAGDRRMLFVGVNEGILEIAANQDFEQIATYTMEPRTFESWVACVVPSGRFASEFARKFEIPNESVSRSGGYVRFRAAGTIYASRSGVALGSLSVPEAWKARE
jgi:hypothetical protein